RLIRFCFFLPAAPGLPGDRADRHRDLLLGAMTSKTARKPYRPAGGLSPAAPEYRLRLGDLEPHTVTEDFCRRAAALPNLCPQFHLSMQSGCDAHLEADEPEVRYRPVSGIRGVAEPLV
ncbi:MAG: hypothetical protein ACLU38_12330, partial [Dysosmobacter sp.]